MFGKDKEFEPVTEEEVRELFEYLIGAETVMSETNKPNFIGHEEQDYKQFKSGHVCPDREVHDNVEFDVSLSYSHASGIGSNTYVKCERCGCMQEITDYGMW